MYVVTNNSQLLLSIVVLGLSVTLARMGHFGSVAPQIGYAVFAAALATFAALAGIASLFIESLRWFAVFVLDGVATLALLVSGIVSPPSILISIKISK